MYCTFALLCCCKHLHNIAWFNFLGKDEDCSEQCGGRSGVRGIALSFIELNCTWSFIELNWEQEVCNSASLCTASMSTVLHQCQLYCARHQCQLYSASVSTVQFQCQLYCALHQCQLFCISVKYFQVYRCATGQHCIHPWIVLHFLLLLCIFTVAL